MKVSFTIRTQTAPTSWSQKQFEYTADIEGVTGYLSGALALMTDNQTIVNIQIEKEQ